MPHSSPRRSRAAVAALATAAVALSPLMVTTQAHAAVAAPRGLEASAGGTSTPTFTWKAVPGATGYRVQADNDSNFSSPELSESTSNTALVADEHLRPGKLHWRVQAVNGKQSSKWSTGTDLVVNPADVPAPTAPANGAVIAQAAAPLLTWTTSRGATSYTVQLDGDSDFIGAETFATKSTSFVIPKALSAGDWYWRVVANKGKDILSDASPTMRFDIAAMQPPALVSPVDTHEVAVEDVVLDWSPVPGAATYDLQIATDRDFNNFAFEATKLTGTRYSPATTPYNDAFWWRVRAVDAAGVSTAWTASRYNFKRQWVQQPQAVHPVGTASAPGHQGGRTTFFEWTPVRHATHYEVEISPSLSFANAIKCRSTTTLTTAGTTFIPRDIQARSSDCFIEETVDENDKKTWWWRVRALDLPYENPDGLPGVWSDPQAFYRTALTTVSSGQPLDANSMLTRWARNLTVSMTGTGAANSATRCTSTPSVGFPESGSYSRPSVCEGLSASPVLSWDPVPDADYYRVWFGVDENITTTEIQPLETRNTMLSLDFRRALSSDPVTFSDSEADRPHNWHVQACNLNDPGNSRDDICSYRPESRAVGISGAASFGKVSPAVTGLRSAAGNTDDIWFEWDDYLTTNLATTSFGQPGYQSSRLYEIQVATDPGFSKVIDEALVDQTTYTSGKGLYPQGTLYWRVRATDAQRRALTWSAVAQVTKSTDPIGLIAPLGGSVAGTTPFQWAAQAFASGYELEVYANGDTAFSPGNRVVAAKTAANAFAPTEPLPASALPYVWRVRKIDNSKNPGPWSAAGTFLSTGTAPVLTAPADGAGVSGSRSLFTWTDVPGAATYEFKAVTGSTTSTVKTPATAYAPTKPLRDGEWTWRVTALDAAGHTLGTSATWSFVIDGSAPEIVARKPRKIKPKSNLVLVFSENIKGASKKTIKLHQKGKKKPLKAKVKVKRTKKGSKVIINPAKNLKRGKTYLVKIKKGAIRDAAGNRMAKVKPWKITLR